jgi:hypothetical protein
MLYGDDFEQLTLLQLQDCVFTKMPRSFERLMRARGPSEHLHRTGVRFVGAYWDEDRDAMVVCLEPYILPASAEVITVCNDLFAWLNKERVARCVVALSTDVTIWEEAK